jgi:splicing factor 3B subunit 2
VSWSRKKVIFQQISKALLANIPIEEEEEEESEAESDEEETREPAPSDGLQTPSGLETPSGMTSVVSTVAGGLETPDFLELRKGRSVSDAMEASGPRSLYQVVPEKQTSVRGLMGSERGYDVSAVASAPLPVLGEERGTKVRDCVILLIVLLN